MMASYFATKKSKRGTLKNVIVGTCGNTSMKISPAPEDVESGENFSNKEDDLFLSFKGMLILGRILGVVPICGVFSNSYRNLETKLLSVPGISSCICISGLILNAILAILNAIHDEKKSILRIAQSIGNPLFACWGLFIYVYIIVNRSRLINVFETWSRASLKLYYTKKEKTLYTTIVVISVIMFASVVLENAILYMEYFEYFDDISGHNMKYGKERANVSVLHLYYRRGHQFWDRYLGYHPVFAFLAFIIHKWILYGWNYLDVSLALFCRALYFKFKSLCEAAEEGLLQPVMMHNVPHSSTAAARRHEWEQLSRDHELLCEIRNAYNNFFSPIVFASYTVNLFFFCMQLLFGLNPESVNHSIVHSIYAPWSFIHVISRIFILTLFASRVNDYAHKVREVIMRCPNEFYNGNVARLDNKVTSGPKLGLAGLGCFVISKPFMLNILNAVFAIEIVLLQALGSEIDKKSPCEPHH